MSSADYDYIVIGSGFGGSVSALRLAEKGYKVAVIEMGRRWSAENLPKTNWNVARYLWRPRLGLRGFLSMKVFRHVMIVHGNAVGGGSITYANTLLVPPEHIWDNGSWAGLDEWKKVMPAHYATAQRMLGVTRNRILGPADHKLKAMANAAGVGDTFYATDVAVFFGNQGDPPGTRYPDPYFGGAGPARNSCIACGGCMVGCRYNAKNTLDKNYLYLAEKNGARVFAETRVVDVRPLNGKADGADGYEVSTENSLEVFGGAKRRFTARGVVFAAGSLGTQELLFRLKQGGSLPNVSDQLGNRVRTNAESIISVRYPAGEDLSKGIAIGSGIHIDEYTHIEAVRYPRGSDLMATLSTVLTHGRPGFTRVFTWLWTLLRLLVTAPLRTLHTLWPLGSAEQSVILLCMQTLDGHLNMRLKRPWYWPFMKTLTTEGERIPTFIPAANRFADLGAKATGGMACTSITEILFNIPTTAHCMGGAGMAESPKNGVIDRHNRVFGYQNLLVCDGSMLSANLGVNPSLTITALTERAMSHVPPARETARTQPVATTA